MKFSMSKIESQYETFLSDLQKTADPVDVNFAMRLMYLERKMAKSLQPSIKPNVVLTIHYKPNVDREKKQLELRTKGGNLVELIADPSELICSSYLNMDDVMQMASDSDIERISGKASPIIKG